MMDSASNHGPACERYRTKTRGKGGEHAGNPQNICTDKALSNWGSVLPGGGFSQGCLFFGNCLYDDLGR